LIKLLIKIIREKRNTGYYTQLQNAQWGIHDCQFYSNLKVLPLCHFDMVLSYDWLAQFSPMEIHWQTKWVAIPYGDNIVVLHGILSRLQEGDVVQLYQLTNDQLPLDSADTMQRLIDLPAEIQHLVKSYAGVFASKVSFPPPRQYTHSIPLVSSARPISVRPYRYAPVLKDEIESQVRDMLDARLIQHSVNPFSSLVLLVRKKTTHTSFVSITGT
jgi:hypothetical protein